MDRGKTISLNTLARSRWGEIDQMLAGIRGELGSTLWTAELRAATRGGKPCGMTKIDDTSTADGTN
jgi:hypothetical protein